MYAFERKFRSHGLGHSDRKTSNEEIGAGLGAAFGSMIPKKKPGMSEAQKREEFNRAYMTSAYEQGMQRQAEKRTEDYLKGLQDQNQNNQLAEKARIGGQYTASGLENAAKTADLDALDRLKMRATMQNPMQAPRLQYPIPGQLPNQPLGLGGSPSPYSMGQGF